ncbi:hypothetical protein P5673_030541, partial [Acropora cervicornis]
MGKTSMSSSVGVENALRLALHFHVLWHHLDQALNQLTGPTPTGVRESTMNMALTMHETLLTFGGVADTCLQLTQGASAIRLDVSKEDIKKKVLCLPGRFCNAKRVYNRFSSSLQRSPQVTEQCELASESLANFKKSLGISIEIQKSSVFYKALPSALAGSKHHLGALNLSSDDYRRKFLKKDDLLPSSKRDTLVGNHPLNEEL